jgi:hypothetical protein
MTGCSKQYEMKVRAFPEGKDSIDLKIEVKRNYGEGERILVAMTKPDTKWIGALFDRNEILGGKGYCDFKINKSEMGTYKFELSRPASKKILYTVTMAEDAIRKQLSKRGDGKF